MEKFLIGCSGYYYPNWKNKFYPKGVQPKNWLEYYSSVFNTVELNGTFYRTPKLSDLEKYARVTSPDFKFSVKMSRYITHIHKLKDCSQQVAEFQNLIAEGLGKKLAYFLFQMPPSFKYSEENLEHLLSSVPHKAQSVVELRHLCWWNGETEKAFKKAGITFCNVDFPGMDTYFIHTSSIFYLRLHGKPELFKSPYSIEQLETFYADFPKNAKQNLVYFNNTYYEAGYTNALQMMEIVKAS